MIPTVGRIVHYNYTRPPEGAAPPLPQAAIITRVALHTQFHKGQPAPKSEENMYRVSLNVFCQETFTSGSLDLPEVPWSKDSKDGHWSWPPRA